MAESLKTRWTRFGFNLFPAYFGTGARLTYIADDFHEIHLKLPLSWRTRNYVGTIFGGSLYGAVDPIYMIMLIKLLGSDYVVWDKAASIRFLRPGKETLEAKFRIEKGEVDLIRSELSGQKSIDRVYKVDLANAAGKVHASVEKTIYIAQKNQTRGD